MLCSIDAQAAGAQAINFGLGPHKEQSPRRRYSPTGKCGPVQRIFKAQQQGQSEQKRVVGVRREREQCSKAKCVYANYVYRVLFFTQLFWHSPRQQGKHVQRMQSTQLGL